MSFQWKRPTTVPFPEVWRRFEAKLPNGEMQIFKIQDLTPDRHEEAWELLLATYYSEEPVFKALKVIEDADLMADIKKIIIKIMQQNASLMAIPEEPADEQQIAGLLVLAPRSRNDELVTFLRGPKAQKYERLMDALEGDIDVFDKLDTDVFLNEYGLAVAPEFRGRHLAHNIIMCVQDIARGLGIGGKMVNLTNLNLLSTTLGENMEIFHKIIYNDFRDEDGNIIVPVTDFEYIAYCGLKIR